MDLAALVAAGDLPQVQGLAFVLAAGDGQFDAGVGEVVAALAAVVAGVRHDGELAVVDGGDGLAGLVLAVGEQVEPGVDDVREQVRGPAAPVEAQQRSRAVPADAAQLREQVLIWAAREADGSAITTSSGSPRPSVTQVSSVAGPGSFSRATCIFCTSRVPK